ncbi:MAG: efflux transporter periplasmic adaptor subunit [Desulfuromonadaceae bacterium GWC2_58_13]|nr:MAG: efflux transporter periplasmic adaptor subunit [Desulfuromonadaceae bacterium GWC2_58_13]
MIKRILITIVGLLVIVGAIAGIKVFQIRKMIESGAQFVPPPETVTTAAVSSESWESLLTAVGSLDAVQGVTLAAELPGKVVDIRFEAGMKVRHGEVLLRQDVSSEQAQLPGAEAEVELTRLNLNRMRELLEQKIIAQSELDSAAAAHQQALAAADNIRAAIAKKSIRAPFAGRLGIRKVNLGQILAEGDSIVSLQALDPIFVNFLLPQQQLGLIRVGQPIRLTTDALPGQEMTGAITAISPEIDAATRNIPIQATVANPEEKLRPGMYASVAVKLPEQLQGLVIPATAVLYAPYSDSVFVVEEKTDEKTGKNGLILRQQFVRLGVKRGDFVAVTTGLKEGETLVSTGVFKLRNGQGVVVDNTLAPEFQLAPKPENN